MLCTSKQPGLRALLAVGLLVAALLGTGSPAAAQTEVVTVQAVDQTLVFSEPTVVTVEIVVENALGVAGVDFMIDYPSTLIARENPTVHETGDLWSTVVVNHDDTRDSPPLAEGFRRIAVAAADAVGRDTASGILLTLDFEVSCAGFAQDWADGRDVVLEVFRVQAFDEELNPLDATGVDGTLTLNCTTVAVESQETFGTLKARYDSTTRER